MKKKVQPFDVSITFFTPRTKYMQLINYTLALPEIFYPLETQLNNFFFHVV